MTSTLKRLHTSKVASKNITHERYLKKIQLLALSFDKDIGICLMTTEEANQEKNQHGNLPQIHKVMLKRKNKNHSVLKKKEKITGKLKDLRKQRKLTKELFSKWKPI